LPFVILGLVFLHLIFLHDKGSTSPLSTIVPDEDYIRFSSYFFVKDLFGLLCVFFLFFLIVFLYPNLLGHPDNYIPANPLVTPVHIVPEWYFLPFYAILRSIPNKLGGVVLMFSSIFILFFITLFSRYFVVRKSDENIKGFRLAYLIQKDF
jgi:quinol-cytochrome oxidoreductase complex cytochrome b subunit